MPRRLKKRERIQSALAPFGGNDRMFGSQVGSEESDSTLDELRSLRLSTLQLVFRNSSSNESIESVDEEPADSERISVLL